MGKRRSPTFDPATLISLISYGTGQDDQEGVCLEVTLGSFRVLLDCGLSDLEPIVRGASPPDIVVCSHAHRDHARGLLALHQRFPKLPIYVSEVTASLLPLNWIDRPQKADFCLILPWHSPQQVLTNLTLELIPAGHLPGAAVVLLTFITPQRTYKLVYTGDFSLSNLQLVEGLSLESLRGLAPDVLIIEGSYGTVRHPHRRQQEKQLMQRIDRALSEGNSVLLPTPTLGLSQEILKLLRSHHQFTGRDVDIWVTDQIAQACDIYLDLMAQLPLSVQNFAKHQPLFWDERIYPRLRRFSSLAHPGDRENLGTRPCILLVETESDIARYLQWGQNPWLVMIPESLYEGQTSPDVELNLRSDVDVIVEVYLLAEHSDGRNTTQLIHNLKPQHVVFVHGSPSYLADLTSLEELQSRYQLHLPASGKRVALPLGDLFIQPSEPIPHPHEGELNELESAITLTLPYAITRDPRWSQFADTGLVEVRWQGEELIVRGISQRELINQQRENRSLLGDTDSCRQCHYYRQPRCWNPHSPLNGFKVTPEGYCPMFERVEGDV
jgi:Cft2 family RNA processing exonuclease